MPATNSTLLFELSTHQLADFGGVDGGEGLALELANSLGNEVIAGGSGAVLFTAHLIDAIQSLGGQVIILAPNQGSANHFKAILAEIQTTKPSTFSVELRQEVDRLKAHLQQVQQPFFDDHSLIDVTGMLLAFRAFEGKELLSRQISFADFLFTPAEYLELKEQVVLTQRLFQKIERIPPAFQDLNAGIFRHQSLEDSHLFIDDLLSRFSQAAARLHRAYLASTNHYYQHRRDEYQRIFRVLQLGVQTVTDTRQLLAEKMGEAALDSAPSRLAAGLSKSQKQQREWIIELHNLLEVLKNNHTATAPFPFTWPPKANELPQPEWPGLLERYQTALTSWFEDHRKLIREECLGLSPRSHGLPPAIGSNLLDHEKQLTALVEEINDSGIFQRPFTVQAETTARQQKLVEQLLEKLQQLRQLLPVYPAFYRWQHNWFSLPARLRKVIAPLLLLPDEDWATIFSSWYFDQGVHQQHPQSVATYTPKQLTELAGTIISTKALKNNVKKRTTPKKPAWSIGEQANQPGNYDLMVSLDDAKAPKELTGPCLRLAPFDTSAPTVHYLSVHGQVNPALAFFQDWYGSTLPDWRAAIHDNSWPAIKNALTSLASRYDISLENAWQALETAYRERGRNGLVIGLKKDQAPATILLHELTQEQFAAVVIVLPQERLIDKQLPTAAHWWSLLLHTPSIYLLHRLPADELTQALLTDGANATYGCAAFIRAAEAIEDQDVVSFQAIAQESRTRLGWKSPAASPLLEELKPELINRLPGFSISLHQPWRTVYLPILLTSPVGKRHLILPEGVLPGKHDVLIELQLQRELAAAGFELHYLYAADLVAAFSATLDTLAASVVGAQVAP